MQRGLTVSLMAPFISLSETGDIYIWGWNESGQLALPTRTLAEDKKTVAGQGEAQLDFHTFLLVLLVAIRWPESLQYSEGACDVLGTRGHTAGLWDGAWQGWCQCQH